MNICIFPSSKYSNVQRTILHSIESIQTLSFWQPFQYYHICTSMFDIYFYSFALSFILFIYKRAFERYRELYCASDAHKHSDSISSKLLIWKFHSSFLHIRNWKADKSRSIDSQNYVELSWHPRHSLFTEEDVCLIFVHTKSYMYNI